MKFLGATAALLGTLFFGRQTYGQGIPLNLDSDDSIRNAASIAAQGMLTYYTGNQPGDVPGNLPPPYYWWEAGAMFGALVDYWYLTGDDRYVALTKQALLHQIGDNQDYMPSNQTQSMGNDDQAFWAISALQAAEYGFPNPPKGMPSWLSLAQAVLNEQATRWETSKCGGGLRWQVYSFNNGWTYKNTISNGCFFNIAARLGRYTKNETYLHLAERTWDWMETVALMDVVDGNYHFHDGADMHNNCSEPNPAQFTYNAGVFLHGSAVMWNATGKPEWKERTEKIMRGAFAQFFKTDPPDVMYEWNCEGSNNCNTDQQSFKAYLSRWMAATTKVAPWTADDIMPKLQASAKYAAMQCSGTGDYPHVCGLHWTAGTAFDGSSGVGQQMAALEVFQSNLVHRVGGAMTPETGATSQSHPAAGNPNSNSLPILEPITTGDQVGASFLTLLALGSTLAGAWWMIR